MRFKLNKGGHGDRGETIDGSTTDTGALARRARAAIAGSKSQDGRDEVKLRDEGEPSASSSQPVQREDEDDVTNSKIAAGRAIGILMKMEHEGFCGVETSSVYGAAVALPQIARSSEWSGTMTSLAIRSYFFLFLNIVIQSFLLSMIGEEQMIMYPFAGQMHLCDFGSNIKRCPDAPDCHGPDGTIYTAARLYGFDIWATRVFLRDSLKAIFPDRIDEIGATADAGEYGLENYWCRMACIFIFMMAVVDDLRSTMLLANVLIRTPNEAENWIRYEVPEWEDKDVAKAIHGWCELDLVKFQVAGMPVVWKVLNFFIILVPKCALWLSLASSGVHYLMETAGIMDVVVNAMALTFVLDVDEMIFSRLATAVTQHIMSNLEDLPLFDTSVEEGEPDQDVLERFEQQEVKGRWRKSMLILPKRLMVIVFMQAFFMATYYFRNCLREEDGSWVSKAMYLPKDLSYRPLSLMFGIEPAGEEDSFWSMPSGE